ncbi:MAG: ATP-dependent helicase [Butyrivibrio sp.]|nr:ATP-dependent helicase [Butyrivibrio sp.]
MEEESFFNKYASALNSKQIDAVKTVEGPVMLLAVPGSGKTTVLVNRLGYMLFVKNIRPENILTLTYTVAATRDMSQRFVKLFGSEAAKNLEFRTINGICAKVISYYGKLIGKTSFELVTDEKITGQILSAIYLRVMGEYPTESDIKTVRTLITYCKNMCLTTEEIVKLGKDEGLELSKIYDSYNAELKSRSLMDYDDQLVYAYRMLKGSSQLLEFYRNKYRYICVDEAQDTSKIQHMIISLLAGKSGNLFMVGDEDQSIYGFRAAYPDAMLNFEKDHPGAKVLVMDQNYRSNAKIVKAADGFIQSNCERHEKHMNPMKEESDDISILSAGSREQQYRKLLNLCRDVNLKGRQTAILYRDNESILPLVDLMERENVPYRIKSADMGFFTHRVVTDVVNILKFALSPMDPELFMKIYFKFQAYLKKPDAEAMCYIADQRHTGILDAAEYVDLHKRVLGNCRSLRTHFKNMVSEKPYKALLRIENYMGYGDYLKDNNIDGNKIFILKMLAKNEDSIESFLSRLEELRQILAEKEDDYNTKLILSTIHSSKGLEYDDVVLIDAINGVFPSKVVRKMEKASPEEKRTFEEERRIFYVGITRAKERLTVYNYDDCASAFVKELKRGISGKKDYEDYREDSYADAGIKYDKSFNKKVTRQATPLLKTPKKKKSNVKIPTELVIGERVFQPKFGQGVIEDVSYDDEDIPTKFNVIFDSGDDKVFVYPFAFENGMIII